MRHFILFLIICISFIAPAQAQTPFTDIIPKGESCEKQQQIAQQVIDRVSYCIQDSDCFSKNFGCPFACASAVSHTEPVTVAEDSVKLFKESCDVECKRRCPAQLKKPKCYFGRCHFKDPTEGDF